MKQQVSDRKRAANRANAQKAPAQKLNRADKPFGTMPSSTACTPSPLLRLPIDDPHIFHALHCEWHRLYTPRDIEEHALLEAFVAAHWRYIRQLSIENRIYTAEFTCGPQTRIVWAFFVAHVRTITTDWLSVSRRISLRVFGTWRDYMAQADFTGVIRPASGLPTILELSVNTAPFSEDLAGSAHITAMGFTQTSRGEA
jgi:hypothetical protein